MLIIHLLVNGLTKHLPFNFVYVTILQYKLLYRSSRVLSETWKYASFPEALARFARLQIIVMNTSETAFLKLDVIILPLAIWRKLYYSNLCPKYASENSFFPGSKCNIIPALPRRGTPPIYQPPLPARSLHSLVVLLGGPLTRIFEGKKPRKCSSQGPESCINI